MSTTAQRSWWQRHWLWVVPAGCLGLVAACAVLGGAIAFLVVGGMRSSWAYQEGVALARAHPRVVEALGEPIETGWFVRGSLHVSGPSGEAELAIPLRGPRGRGTLYVIAEKTAGRWDLELAEVAIRGRGDRIDLLDRIELLTGPTGRRVAPRTTRAGGEPA